MSIQDLRDVKIITAMITPFKEDGSINFDVLPELIEHLLAHHTEGILLAGTTAESPTLTTFSLSAYSPSHGVNPASTAKSTPFTANG